MMQNARLNRSPVIKFQPVFYLNTHEYSPRYNIQRKITQITDYPIIATKKKTQKTTIKTNNMMIFLTSIFISCHVYIVYLMTVVFFLFVFKDKPVTVFVGNAITPGLLIKQEYTAKCTEGTKAGTFINVTAQLNNIG